MSVAIEVKKLKEVMVGNQWLKVGKNPEVFAKCNFENVDGDDAGEYPGGILSFDDPDGDEVIVSLADIRAMRFRK